MCSWVSFTGAAAFLLSVRVPEGGGENPCGRAFQDPRTQHGEDVLGRARPRLGLGRGWRGLRYPHLRAAQTSDISPEPGPSLPNEAGQPPPLSCRPWPGCHPPTKALAKGRLGSCGHLPLPLSMLRGSRWSTCWGEGGRGVTWESSASLLPGQWPLRAARQ